MSDSGSSLLFEGDRLRRLPGRSSLRAHGARRARGSEPRALLAVSAAAAVGPGTTGAASAGKPGPRSPPSVVGLRQLLHSIAVVIQTHLHGGLPRKLGRSTAAGEARKAGSGGRGGCLLASSSHLPGLGSKDLMLMLYQPCQFVFLPWADIHGTECLPPGRLPLGAESSGNNSAGDERGCERPRRLFWDDEDLMAK